MADQYTIFDKDPDTMWDDLMRGDTPLFIKKPGGGIFLVQLSKTLS